MITLPGSFDLHINNFCTLHCKGCITLDYLGDTQEGSVTIPQNLNLNDVKIVMENLKRLDLRLNELKLIGGEPTLHNQLDEIIDYLLSTRNSYKLFNKLAVLTNGTNFTPSVVESLIKVDRLIISVYPFEEIDDLGDAIRGSALYKHFLVNNLVVDFWRQNNFQKFGQKQPDLEYSTELNWKRCYQKDDCRAITKEGLYHCDISYNEKKDMCDWKDRQKVIDFIHRTEPLGHCKDCPWPPLETWWTSNNLPIDEKNLYRGINLINEYTAI
jgi:organic radical activating enzyme